MRDRREGSRASGEASHPGEEKVVRLEGTNGQLERVVFESGEPLPRRALFLTTGQTQRSHLAEALGCEFWVVVAAAEGAEAAFSINQDLLKESLTAS